MKKMDMLYEGKAKKVFLTDDPDILWIEYKDDATAFDGKKKGTIMGKGELNNAISSIFFSMLKDHGIENHFVEKISDTEQLVKRTDIIMVEVIVRNIAAGGMAKRLGIPEGTPLKSTVVEFCYKSDELGDPMINDYHIAALDLATKEQVAEITDITLKVNEVLKQYLAERKVKLVDFKLEFGLFHGKVLLSDEISPDTCRFWDSETNEKLDKDRFRRDMGHVEDAYREILKRLTEKA
ncbi:MAG TPA: phosphoribosylaminoimidazolesuccinocarboxamide synthase [Firmicutes bacterium]|nr:phosphoribosylaminoimidazolesuccinocarboxamide synthase [Bacillota bacterium]